MSPELTYQRKLLDWIADKPDLRRAILLHFDLPLSRSICCAGNSWEELYAYLLESGIVAAYEKEKLNEGRTGH